MRNQKIKTAAVFIGRGPRGPWQRAEAQAIVRKSVEQELPVIPVLLKTAARKPKVPLFLESLHWVDFRKDEPDPLEQLVFGITGERIRER